MSKPNNKKKRVPFQLSAPEAKYVCLAGDFNAWDVNAHPLKKRGNGNGANTWRTVLNLAPGTYEYRYLIDGEWRNDPSAPERMPNRFGTLNDVIKV